METGAFKHAGWHRKRNEQSWPEISDMKTARARISRPIWPRNIQRVCMTSIRQNEIEGVVAHLEHLPRSL